MDRDDIYMRRCIELAKLAAEKGDVPVGAVVVRQSDGEIVGEGFNRRELDRSSLSHAELIAIDEASVTLTTAFSTVRSFIVPRLTPNIPAPQLNSSDS